MRTAQYLPSYRVIC